MNTQREYARAANGRVHVLRPDCDVTLCGLRVPDYEELSHYHQSLAEMGTLPSLCGRCVDREAEQ